MTLDFTLKKYAQLCETIRQLGCPVMTVQDFLKVGQPKKFLIVLRHDVDRRVDAALHMAKLEAEFRLNSTYYVRKQPSVFRPEALKRLYSLGHEIGYHYEVLSKARGNPQKAIQLFEKELKQFRESVPISTISMHGSPLSPWNNLDLWAVFNFEAFDLAGDAVLSLNTEEIYYLTDTGRAWDASRFNIRDTMNSKTPLRPLHKTDDLIVFLQEQPAYPIFINAHPNRWAADWLSWSIGAVSDWAINQAKWVVAGVRSLRAQSD